MGVRGLSGHALTLAAPVATRTPAAPAAGTLAAEGGLPRPVPDGAAATVRAIAAHGDGIATARTGQARQEHGAPRGHVEPALARHAVHLRVDAESRRIVAQLVDDTNTVIKQIPPQELLELAARFRKINGLLFDRAF
jgi:hypothetical protein